MRIIPVKVASKSSRFGRFKGLGRLGLVVLGVVVISVLWYGYVGSNKRDVITTNHNSTAPAPTPPKEASKQLKTFTANEFKELFDKATYANVLPTETPPSITGNTKADERIRSIATKRGYKLRPQAAGNLSEIEGSQLQAPLIEPYRALKAAARAAGLDLNIVSGYRSYGEQRGIFTAQMKVKGASADSVAAGKSDDVVDAILKVNSIPGYSRHHTGYTVDFQCAQSGLDNFVKTPCFAWLSADNYKVAKEQGFIPSYPGGASDQGPNPEEWEYVWVGTDVLYN